MAPRNHSEARISGCDRTSIDRELRGAHRVARGFAERVAEQNRCSRGAEEGTDDGDATYGREAVAKPPGPTVAAADRTHTVDVRLRRTLVRDDP